MTDTLIEHHWSIQKKTKSEHDPIGPPRVFLVYRYTCSCGFKTRFNESKSRLLNVRDQHALEGQISLLI